MISLYKSNLANKSIKRKPLIYSFPCRCRELNKISIAVSMRDSSKLPCSADVQTVRDDANKKKVSQRLR